MKDGKSNWLEEHPLFAIGLATTIGLMLTIFAAEKTLAWVNSGNERPGAVRYVRLRENPPRTVHSVRPTESYLRATGTFDSAKHRLKIDENGFIYPSRVHATPDLNLVFLGGSTTECLYVEEENRFPYVVGRLLERDGKKVNSYNGGVAGNHSLHSIDALINKVMPLHPEIVVMMHNINDLAVLLHEGTYWNDSPTRSLIFEDSFRHSFISTSKNLKDMLIPNLYIALRDAYYRTAQWLGKPPDEFQRARQHAMAVSHETLVKEFESNLQIFIDISRAYNVTPVLMTEASRLKEEPDPTVRGGMGNLPIDLDFEYGELRELFLTFNATIRRVGTRNAVLVIDLEKAVPQEPDYIYDVIHFSDKGSKHVAKIIASELAKVLSVSRRIRVVRGRSGDVTQ